MTAEELARELHEAGREAVEKGCIVRRDVPNKGFIEWDDLDDAAREGRMIQARYLLGKFDVIDRGRTGMGIFRTIARTELKEKVPDVSDETLLYLNHAVTQAYSLGRGMARPTNATLGPEEIDFLAQSPEALIVLADYYHSVQETMADAIGDCPECVNYHEKRRKELRELAAVLDAERQQ